MAENTSLIITLEQHSGTNQQGTAALNLCHNLKCCREVGVIHY